MRQTGTLRGHSPKALALQWGSWAALAAGAVLCAVGWYGVSGERFAERQLPYLASCTIPGAALIVAGAVLLARGDQGLAAARVDELYALLLAADAETAGVGAGGRERSASGTGSGDDDGVYVAVPGGTLYHRESCPLVSGKEGAVPAAEATAAGRRLTPCPVCEPAPVPEA